MAKTKTLITVPYWNRYVFYRYAFCRYFFTAIFFTATLFYRYFFTATIENSYCLIVLLNHCGYFLQLFYKFVSWFIKPNPPKSQTLHLKTLNKLASTCEWSMGPMHIAHSTNSILTIEQHLFHSGFCQTATNTACNMCKGGQGPQGQLWMSTFGQIFLCVTYTTFHGLSELDS